MSQQVIAGAEMLCTFGTTPVPLNVLPEARVMIEGRPGACIMDHDSLVHILPFGACHSPSNPAIAAGSPQGPCIPVAVAPWEPGAATVFIGGFPALNQQSQCICTLEGVIKIVLPGSMRTMIP